MREQNYLFCSFFLEINRRIIQAYGLMVMVIISTIVMSVPARAFTGEEFLKWNTENQRFYFETSVTMAGVIVAQRNREVAGCLDDWLEAQSQDDYPNLLEAIRTYPTYHPQGVILAVLRKACGSF